MVHCVHILRITICNNNAHQIKSTLQFTGKLRNFLHIISMQSNGAVITPSEYGFGSGLVRRRIYGHIRLGPGFQKIESCTSLDSDMS